MDNKKKLPPQKGKVVENTSTAKTKTSDAPDAENVTEPKDSRSMADPKKTGTDQKKTVTIVSDSRDKGGVIEPKEWKTVMISDPKDKKPEMKDKRTVTFVTDIKDKRIVTDTKENKIMSIETKEKVPVVSEAKEKKSVPLVEPKEKVVLPSATAVPEVKEKLMALKGKEKKEMSLVSQIKEVKASQTTSEMKEKKAVTEMKEVSATELKEKKIMLEAREKSPMVTEIKDDGTSDIAQTIVEGVLAAAVQFVEDARNPIKNINWLTHGEFTVEDGRKQIEKFVSDMPVDVSYIFENSALLQRPGKIRFREQWLRDITETKHILLESIPFKVV